MRMNVNLYLPDDIGQRAKDEELPLSSLLRAAVIEELERRRAMNTTLGNTTEILLDLEDEDGHSFTGRITGVEIADNDDGEWYAYVTDDERVILHNAVKAKHWVIPDHEVEADFRRVFSEGVYAHAMRALGRDPVIDL